MAPSPGGAYQPSQPVTPVTPVASPGSTPAHRASHARLTGRPTEPWKASLRLMMFIWGAVLLAAFATPLSLDPLVFHWDAILDGEGSAKLPPLVIAAVGLLALVIAAIPLAPAARGVIAMVLGLAGIFTPLLLSLADAEIGLPLIVNLVAILGWVVLVSSLLVRHEYRDTPLPRILVTFGALAALAPWVVPVGGDVPLVGLFQMVIDAPGAAKVVVILLLVQVVLIILSLLAWLPAPSGGMAKPLAWLLILWGLVLHAATLFLVVDPSMVEQTPYAGVMAWVVQGGPGSAGLGVAYLAIVGYGTASVIGKQLE